jgi:PAS domain S-box-containing protein
MNLKRSAIYILLLISIILVILSSGITHYFSIDKRKSADWIFQTYLVIHSYNDLLASVVDMETGKSGYIITGDSTFLEPYHKAKSKLPTVIDSLKSLISDNPQQSSLLENQIVKAVRSRERFFEKAIITYNTIHRDSAIAMIKTREGKYQMDSLRALIDNLIHDEQLLLRQRTTKYERKNIRDNILRFSTFGIIGLTSLLSLTTLIKKQKSIDKLIHDLESSNDLLEARVRDRTLELESKEKETARLNMELSHNLEELSALHDALQIRNAKSEDALAEIKDLFDHAPCGYHSLDNKGMVIRINETELEWLGYKRDDVLNRKHFRDLVTSESMLAFDETKRVLEKEGFIRNQDFELVRKDGSKFPAAISSSAVYDERGEYVATRSTIFDISERKKLEEKLIRLNKDKDHFIGIATHDLKTPLTGIFGLVRLMKDDGSNRPPSDIEYLTYIEEACINLQQLVTNLLDINRIETGLTVVNRQTFDIGLLLTSLKKEFLEFSRKKSIELDIYQISGLINTDEYSLKRILENLISNAIKFSPTGKKVMVITTLDHREVHIKVVDHGIGIPDKEIPFIFEKFHRSTNRPTGDEMSTGLGLSIVKELVTLLGGEIGVVSEVGEGTTFFVNLPVNL